MTYELRFIGGGCDPTPDRYYSEGDLWEAIKDASRTEVDDYLADFVDDPEDDEAYLRAWSRVGFDMDHDLRTKGRYTFPYSRIGVRLKKVTDETAQA